VTEVRPGIRHLVLIGLMGAGKTTVGALVARRLGLPLVDGDALLAAWQGVPATTVHDRAGVDALHHAEARVLLDALRGSAPAVIAPAASVVDDAACRAALRSPGVAVAWLRADPAVLGHRFAAGAAAGATGSHRPAYGGDPAAFLAAQARRRGRRFAACRPRVVVDTGRLGPEEAADRIVAALAAGGEDAELRAGSAR
jgi:shikimate kinase